MTLSRLASTTQQHSPESVERARVSSRRAVRQVDPVERATNEKERSLLQELAAIDPRLSQPFSGDAKIQRDTRELASKLRKLDKRSCRLILLDAPVAIRKRVDDQV